MRQFILWNILIAWCACGSILCDQRIPPAAVFELPASSKRVILTEEGEYFVLGSHSNAIRKYSGKGTISWSREFTQEVGITQLVDFVIDIAGRLHVLAWVLTDADGRGSESAILRFENDGPPDLVRLSKSIQSWRFDMDELGNYYLLGVETAIHTDFMERGSCDGPVQLVHKFSPAGEWSLSLFQVPTPGTWTDYDTGVIEPLLERNHFCVSRNGEVRFLMVNKPPGSEAWEWTRTLFASGRVGEVQILNVPAPSDTSFVYSIQKYGSDVLIEWVDRQHPLRRILTNLEGDPIWESESVFGRVVAVGSKEVLTEALGSKTYHLFVQCRAKP
jgi:hypothetical protein